MRVRRREYRYEPREPRLDDPFVRDEPDSRHAEPDDPFVRNDDSFVNDDRQPRRRRERVRVAPRAALAVVLTLAVVATVVAVGGKAAVRPAVDVVHLVKQAVGPTSNANGPAVRNDASSSQSAASNQYKFIVCHRPPGNPSNAHTLEVGSQAAVDAHLSHHPGDTPGPCPK